MTFVLVAGTTETARIEGISAAGADPAAMADTPTADAEILTKGQPVNAPAVPVSPTGCPTPALLTRGVRELAGFDVTVLDAGLATEPGISTRIVATDSGGDVRTNEPVPGADVIWKRAKAVGEEVASESDEHVYVGETIPGGTTTALGVGAGVSVEPPLVVRAGVTPVALLEQKVTDDVEGDGNTTAVGLPEELSEVAALLGAVGRQVVVAREVVNSPPEFDLHAQRQGGGASIGLLVGLPTARSGRIA